MTDVLSFTGLFQLKFKFSSHFHLCEVIPQVSGHFFQLRTPPAQLLQMPPVLVITVMLL